MDWARLAFYDLPSERRRDVLAAQAARQSDAEAVLTEAQRREREAESQRHVALHAAQTARTEAERLVSPELARLLEVEGAQSSFEMVLAQGKAAIAVELDVSLGWQERARKARTQTDASADETYEALRGALRSARTSLAAAPDELSEAPSHVPLAGEDALATLSIEVDTTEARKERNLSTPVRAAGRRARSWIGAERRLCRRRIVSVWDCASP